MYFFPLFELCDNFCLKDRILLDFLLHNSIDTSILINEFIIPIGMVLLFGLLALDTLLWAHLYI